MSRAYHIFVGRLSTRAAQNRHTAVVEYSGSFPLVEPQIEPESTASTALEILSRESYIPPATSNSRQSLTIQSEEPPLSIFSKKWGSCTVKVIEPGTKKKRKLRTFKLMEQLPTELRRAIIEHVDLESLKRLRCTSKSWAALGEEYLISELFSTMPYRPDTERLTAISKHPKFSYRIQHINFNHGEVNEYHARHNTYFALYTREPETRAAVMASCWNSFAMIREKKNEYLPNSCDRQVLTDIFGNLPNLRSVSINLMENPFGEEHHELLKSLWEMPSSRHLPRVATTERFTTILAAIASNSSTISIKTLAHDRLPFEFFAQKESTLSLFTPVLESLTSLTLALDYSDMPNNLHARQAFDRLARFLQTAKSLQTLSLALQGRRKVDISPLLTATTKAFADIKKITLVGIIASETGLGDFLVRQKTSLREVQLGDHGIRSKHQSPNGGVHLSNGSFRGLFERLGREMRKDCCVRVLGDLVGLESGERWVLGSLDDARNLEEYVMD